MNVRTRRGQTPLHLCVFHEADACLRQLLLRGADTSQVNEDNQTPLEYALLTNRNEQAAILTRFNPADIGTLKRGAKLRVEAMKQNYIFLLKKHFAPTLSLKFL